METVKMTHPQERHVDVHVVFAVQPGCVQFSFAATGYFTNCDDNTAIDCDICGIWIGARSINYQSIPIGDSTRPVQPNLRGSNCLDFIPDNPAELCAAVTRYGGPHQRLRADVLGCLRENVLYSSYPAADVRDYC